MSIIESKDGVVVSKVYTLSGDLILESNSPKWWWIFRRSEPIDYMAKYRQGGDSEVARVYIAQGMEIQWA